MDAVKNVNAMRYKELHENEVPIAMITYQQAEMNRDRDKQREAYKLNDFYCYPELEEIDTVDGVYGASAMVLIERGLFPGWALFVYGELSKNAGSAKPADLLCYQCQTAIILAPREIVGSGQIKGMLIAVEDASMRILEMHSPDFHQILIRMPKIGSKVVAIENCVLDIVR